MRYIPYVIVGLVIVWAIFSIVRFVSNKKKGKGCTGCSSSSGCAGCMLADNKKEDND